MNCYKVTMVESSSVISVSGSRNDANVVITSVKPVGTNFYKMVLGCEDVSWRMIQIGI